MRATIIHGAGDVRLEQVPDPALENPTDAIVDVTHSCICGSDLWRYRDMAPSDEGSPIGHEFIGLVREVGSAVTTVKPGDLVVAPFVISCGECDFCRSGLQTSCRNGGGWGSTTNAGQGESVRVPHADGTLVALPVDVDDARLPSLLTLSDVLGTGHHAALGAKVGPGSTVAVLGDGAVGLCAVLAAKRLGASRVVIMGRHRSRTDIAERFGATDVVASRGEEAIAEVRALTGGDGVDCVIEAVGTQGSWDTALGIVKDGGGIGYVGIPHLENGLDLGRLFRRNISLGGGVAPTRAYIEEFLPEILDGTIEPGLVFDRTVGLDEVAEGYRAMDDREAVKVLLRVR